jgi:hypothetical protein
MRLDLEFQIIWQYLRNTGHLGFVSLNASARETVLFEFSATLAMQIFGGTQGTWTTGELSASPPISS